MAKYRLILSLIVQGNSYRQIEAINRLLPPRDRHGPHRRQEPVSDDNGPSQCANMRKKTRQKLEADSPA